MDVASEQVTHRGLAAGYTGKTNSGVPRCSSAISTERMEPMRENENNKKQKDWDRLLRGG